MKAIILVLSAKECMNLLNGDLSILVRKKFPKDYVGWIYIYCMKAIPYLVRGNGLADYLAKEYDKDFVPRPKKFELYNFEDEGYSAEFYDFFNGKVVARFWCNNVEEVKFNMDYVFGGLYNIRSYSNEKCFERDCCLNQEELDNYLNKNNNKRDNVGTAIHITCVQPFDRPKGIKEFGRVVLEPRFFNGGEYYEEDKYPLTRAPSTYCYIEI